MDLYTNSLFTRMSLPAVINTKSPNAWSGEYLPQKVCPVADLSEQRLPGAHGTRTTTQTHALTFDSFDHDSQGNAIVSVCQQIHQKFPGFAFPGDPASNSVWRTRAL